MACRTRKPSDRALCGAKAALQTAWQTGRSIGANLNARACIRARMHTRVHACMRVEKGRGGAGQHLLAEGEVGEGHVLQDDSEVSGALQQPCADLRKREGGVSAPRSRSAAGFGRVRRSRFEGRGGVLMVRAADSPERRPGRAE